LKDRLFKTDKASFQTALENEVRRSFSGAVSGELSSQQDPQKYLEGLEEALKKVGEIKIQIAFELNNRNFLAIKDWVSKNIEGFVVLDIYYNPAIIGGASISYNGKYYDGTLITKITNIKDINV